MIPLKLLRFNRLPALDVQGDTRIGVTFGASVLVHAILLFGIAFKAPDIVKQKDFSPPLEVVLVNAKTATKPAKADALAQANLEGGGNTDADRRAKSPLPAQDKDRESAVEQKARRLEELESQARVLMRQLKNKPEAEPTRTQRQQPQPEPDKTADATELVARSLEAARLEAQISRDWDNYQKRPRRKFIGARTSEYAFARYVEDWRIKVERVGNLNYPEAARVQKIYGQLQLTVSIKSDGSVESVEVSRSSGHKVLDAAAVRIVQLSSPFAAFPDDIRSKVDILSITRTWTFTRADQLVAE